MRKFVLGLVAMPSVGALLLACGGAVSLVPPEELDSGSPVPALDAGPPRNDASVIADSPSDDPGPVPDAPPDTAPNFTPDAAPPPCAMQLDPTFGVGGISTLVTPFLEAQPVAIAFEPDAKILVGTSGTVGRFDQAGAIDPTYGAGGFAQLSPPYGADPVYTGGLSVQPDGKTLLSAYDENTPQLVRLDPDGTADTTFGGNGYGGGYAVQTSQWPNWWHTLALLDDGSILVAGGADFDTGGITLFLAKYDRDGVVDATFGAGGSVSTSTMGSARQMLAQPDGTFLVGGDVYAPMYPGTSPVQPALERYTAAGALDLGFGSGGAATMPTSQGGLYVVGMVRQSTGAIVVALAMGGTPNDDFLLVRYTAGGQLDPTFGSGGSVRTDFFGSRDYSAGVSLLADDALLVAGSVTEPADAGGLVDLGIARYTADGLLDATFAPGGKLVTRFPEGRTIAIGAQGLQPDGKLVVAAYGQQEIDGGTDSLLTLARYACR